MPTLSKDALRPGLFRKGDNLHVVSRERINDLHDSFQVLRDKGYRFPVVMEHPGLNNEQSYPVHESDNARIEALQEDPMFVGWVKDLKVSGDSTLRPEIEVEDEGMTKKLTNRGAFVSPQFGPFTDRDRETHFAFHHLALTRKPVMKEQSKQFLRVQAFSEATDVDDEEIYQFGLKDEVLEFDSYGGGFDTSPDRQVEDQSEGDQDDQTAVRLKRVFQQALSSMGVHVANDSPIFNDAEAMQQIMSLLHSCVSKSQQAKDSPMPTGKNPQQQAGAGGNPAGTDERQVTVTMSQAEVDALRASQKEMQDKIAVLSAQNDIQQAALTKGERAKLNARIDAALKSGRMLETDANALRTVVNAYVFSEADKSDNQVAVARLETFERLPRGTFWDDAQKVSEFSEHNIGTTEFAIGGGDEMSAERLDKALQEEGYAPEATGTWHGGIKNV